MKQAIINAHIVTMDEQFTYIEDGYIAFDESGILAIGEMSHWSNSVADNIIDAEGGIVIPGLINLHTHVGMIPFRSLADDHADRLHTFLLPLEEACMNEKLAAASSQYAMAEMLQSGITTFVDMYYFEDAIAEAASEMHVRAFLGETVMKAPTCDAKDEHGGIAYAERFIEKWQGHKFISPFIAPHATYSNDPNYLQKAYAVAEKYDTLFSIHTSEMPFEMKQFETAYGKSPIAFLDDLGMLSERTLLAHCIYTDNADRKILSERNARVAHCPGANMKSGKGIASVYEMQQAGVLVGLGTDGPSSNNTLDIFSQMNLAAKAQKTKYSDRTICTSKDIFKMATIDAVKILQKEDRIGSLEVGKEADITIISTKRANMFPISDIYAVLVYSAQAADVEHVFVAGKQLLKHKALTQQSIEKLRENLDNEMTDFKQKAATFAK